MGDFEVLGPSYVQIGEKWDVTGARTSIYAWEGSLKNVEVRLQAAGLKASWSARWFKLREVAARDANGLPRGGVDSLEPPSASWPTEEELWLLEVLGRETRGVTRRRFLKDLGPG